METQPPLCTLFLTALLFLKGIVRVSPMHMTQSIVPAIMLIAVLAAQFPTLRQQMRVGLVLIVAWALLCFITPARRDLDMLRANLPLLHPNNPGGSLAQACHPQPGLDRAKCLIRDPEESQAILYVQSRTAPNDRIFVGVPRYDVRLDNDISLYLFAKRDAGTKWHDLHRASQALRC